MMDESDTPPLRVLGIAGSVRRRSYNRALLEAARELAPEGMVIETFDLAPLPIFDEDVEREGDPAPVAALRAAVAAADALLLATPEYNYGIPGVLKNAIDWVSRPAGRSVLQGKPVALMGATPTAYGTVRAQLQLRQALYNKSHVIAPEVLVPLAAEKFDGDLRLVDEPTRIRVRTVLAELAAWTAFLRSRGA